MVLHRISELRNFGYCTKEVLYDHSILEEKHVINVLSSSKHFEPFWSTILIFVVNLLLACAMLLTAVSKTLSFTKPHRKMSGGAKL